MPAISQATRSKWFRSSPHPIGALCCFVPCELCPLLYQFLLLAALIFSSIESQAENIIELKGASPKFPNTGAKYEDAYQALLTVVGENLPEIKMSLSATPVNRAMRDIETGTLDFYFPVMCAFHQVATRSVKVGSESIGYIPMALYSKHAKPITRADLESGTFRVTKRSLEHLKLHFNEYELRKIGFIDASFTDAPALLDAVSSALGRGLSDDEKDHLRLSTFEYVVESMRMQKTFLTFPVRSSNSITNSFKKFTRGRIDAYIIPPLQFEALIARAGIESDVFRSVFDTHTLCYLVANSERGVKVDTLLKKGFNAVKKDGTYDALFGQNDLQERQWVEKYRDIPINETAD